MSIKAWGDYLKKIKLRGKFGTVRAENRPTKLIIIKLILHISGSMRKKFINYSRDWYVAFCNDTRIISLSYDKHINLFSNL